jgi:hypothetical protein
MGEHDAPVSWLERWREQEPLRLYLWAVALSVVAGALVAGWMTQELAVAVTGMAAAVLMIGGTAAARRDAYSPLTVPHLLRRQHAESYERGARAAMRYLEDYTAQLPEGAHPVDDLVTEEMRAHPETVLMPAAGRCRHVEDSRRCTLPRHPDDVGHRLEGAGVRE